MSKRLDHLFPRRYYKRFQVGRLVIWIFPFWWSGGQTVIGRTIGPVTYFLKDNTENETPK